MTVKPALKLMSLMLSVGVDELFHFRPYPVKVEPFKKAPVDVVSVSCLADNNVLNDFVVV